MAKVIARATDSGLVVSHEDLERAGVSAGDLVEVDFSRLPDAERIRTRALAYCVRKLGDALLARRPAWNGETWSVELRAPEGDVSLGHVVLDARGEVLEGQSATYQSVREAYYAARPSAAPAK